ncbi:MAG: hypothetical protein JWN76_3622 [Chitinophagaceae bacterium]|nr:hypothetical protein [Chitinophagaceae bacterium]
MFKRDHGVLQATIKKVNETLKNVEQGTRNVDYDLNPFDIPCSSVLCSIFLFLPFKKSKLF